MLRPDTVDDDMRDVLGELANMIGGNMKCVLGAGIRLGASLNDHSCAGSVRLKCPVELIEESQTGFF